MQGILVQETVFARQFIHEKEIKSLTCNSSLFFWAVIFQKIQNAFQIQKKIIGYVFFHKQWSPCHCIWLLTSNNPMLTQRKCAEWLVSVLMSGKWEPPKFNSFQTLLDLVSVNTLQIYQSLSKFASKADSTILYRGRWTDFSDMLAHFLFILQIKYNFTCYKAKQTNKKPCPTLVRLCFGKNNFYLTQGSFKLL